MDETADVEEQEREEEPTKDWSSERAVAVERMIRQMEDKLGVDQFKASIGDYIRLIQVRKELGEERPSEMVVTWGDASGEGNVFA